MRVAGTRHRKVYPIAKRVVDVVLATMGLVVLSPLFLLIAIAIKADSRGPVFFTQERVGAHKTPFRILKFRTMHLDTPQDTPTHLLADPERHITRVGRFLRGTSLDELPQILNVLVGTMSVVGPRPALWNQNDLVAAREEYGANDVRPGITGWAQVNGRDELPIEAKAKLDGDYIAMMSLRTDAACFFRTIVTVLRRDGVVEGSRGHQEDKK